MLVIEIQTDGASKGNPGISGAGVVIKNEQLLYEYSFPLGNASNHEAEFLAVIKALEICAKKFPDKILALQTDSQIVVDSIEKNYVKNPLFKPLLAQINDLKETFPLFFIIWIPNEQNKHADRLAREAIYSQKN